VRNQKRPEKKIAKPLYPAPAHPWHGRAQWHDRATQHGQAVPLFWLAGRAGVRVHDRAPLCPSVPLPILRVMFAKWRPILRLHGRLVVLVFGYTSPKFSQNAIFADET